MTVSNTPDPDSLSDSSRPKGSEQQETLGAEQSLPERERLQQQSDSADDDTEQLLLRFGPHSPPPRDEYRRDLKSRFVAGVEGSETADKPSRWPALGDALSGWLRGSAPLIAVGAAAVVVIAALVWPEGRSADPVAISRSELVARNHEAWQEIDSLAGSFETGSGGYYEEWVAWAPEQPPQYRRLALAGASDSLDGQWRISDGATEWSVDAASGGIVDEAPAPTNVDEAPLGGGGMQCAALQLPGDLGPGPEPTLGQVRGRAAYALDGVDSATGEGRIYWLDASDSLVILVTDTDGGLVWARGQLTVNPMLAEADFRPDNMSRINS